MSTEINVRVLLKSRPNGFPTEDDFDVVESPIPQPQQGEILMESLWLSLDPYMRGRMNEAKSYAPSVNVGESMVGGAVARVVESRSPLFSPGDIVEGRFGWQSYAISNGIGVRKVDESLAPVQTAVGVLGMPGLTAYFGFLDVCDPKPGDTVVVSAASGAVGQIVGQIAKIMGCKVVGTAGSEAKVKFIVDELGFDYAINYKTTDVAQSLDELCPEGIDVYFENVGGKVLDSVLPLLNDFARIPVCGIISAYNSTELPSGPNLFTI